MQVAKKLLVSMGWSVTALLLFGAPQWAAAQSFRVQCPDKTDLHPPVASAGGPLPNPGIKCQHIGGGDGFQASMLASEGYDVESIEVESSSRTFFDVHIYDGRTIPFEPAEFDCVYSSNVLEHVKDLALMNAEIRRVLKPGGIAIHILPSTAWRFWTNLTHYPYVVRYALTRKHSIPTHGELGSPRDVVILSPTVDASMSRSRG